MTELMKTREVARYLGINEKKVYSLANFGKIPCTRVTGKWTFPKKLIDQWIEESASGLVARKSKFEEPAFLLGAGSDDPSLGILHELYLARTQTPSLFINTVGSSGGLAAIRSGVADFATAHLFEPRRPGADDAALKLLPPGAIVIESSDFSCSRAIPKASEQSAISGAPDCASSIASPAPEHGCISTRSLRAYG